LKIGHVNTFGGTMNGNGICCHRMPFPPETARSVPLMRSDQTA